MDHGFPNLVGSFNFLIPNITLLASAPWHSSCHPSTYCTSDIKEMGDTPLAYVPRAVQDPGILGLGNARVPAEQ